MHKDALPIKSIDNYIAQCPNEIQKSLQSIRQIIQSVAPEAVETINYQIPTFKINGKNLVHFAAFKAHIGFYPSPSGISAFKEQLSKYKISKGAVQFPLNEELPMELIRKMVQFRLKEMHT